MSKSILRSEESKIWESINPVIGKSQVGLEIRDNINEYKIKIGDGKTRWNDLPYFKTIGDIEASDVSYEGSLSATNVQDGLNELNNKIDDDVIWDEITGDQSVVNISGFNNDAGYLTSVPDLDASKITTGIFEVDRIPDLSSSKITDFDTTSRELLSASSPIIYDESTGEFSHEDNSSIRHVTDEDINNWNDFIDSGISGLGTSGRVAGFIEENTIGDTPVLFDSENIAINTIDPAELLEKLNIISSEAEDVLARFANSNTAGDGMTVGVKAIGGGVIQFDEYNSSAEIEIKSGTIRLNTDNLLLPRITTATNPTSVLGLENGKFIRMPWILSGADVSIGSGGSLTATNLTASNTVQGAVVNGTSVVQEGGVVLEAKYAPIIHDHTVSEITDFDPADYRLLTNNEFTGDLTINDTHPAIHFNDTTTDADDAYLVCNDNALFVNFNTDSASGYKFKINSSGLIEMGNLTLSASGADSVKFEGTGTSGNNWVTFTRPDHAEGASHLSINHYGAVACLNFQPPGVQEYSLGANTDGEFILSKYWHVHSNNSPDYLFSVTPSLSRFYNDLKVDDNITTGGYLHVEGSDFSSYLYDATLQFTRGNPNYIRALSSGGSIRIQGDHSVSFYAGGSSSSDLGFLVGGSSCRVYKDLQVDNDASVSGELRVNDNFVTTNVAKGDHDLSDDQVMILCPWPSSGHDVNGSIYFNRTSGFYAGGRVDIVLSSKATVSSFSDVVGSLHVQQGHHNSGKFNIHIVKIAGENYLALRRQGPRYFITKAYFEGFRSFNSDLFGTWYDTANVTLLTKMDLDTEFYTPTLLEGTANNSNFTDINLPSGWTAENTCILSVHIQKGTIAGTFWYSGFTDGINAILRQGDNIVRLILDIDYQDRPYRILISRHA